MFAIAPLSFFTSGTLQPARKPLAISPVGGDAVAGGFEVWGLILRVLDAFRPRGATWSGQVISSPPGARGGPSKKHLPPGGGVPRVHTARSPVPPRLSLFATPRSVHHSNPWLRALTHCVAPLMPGRPGRRRCRARATGLSPVGPPWAGAVAA